MSLQYPLYLIPHHRGFASIVDPESTAEPSYLLVVHSQFEQAEGFMERCRMEGHPRAIRNDREFHWILSSLKSPVGEVVFDPSANVEQGLRCRWRVAVPTLMEEHLKVDYSPWDYPVFVIRQAGGYASIAGEQPDSASSAWTALALFTTRQRASAYLEQAGEQGEPSAVDNVQDARNLLEQLREELTAVALNPVAENESRTAKHCFQISTLLEKYLVFTNHT